MPASIKADAMINNLLLEGEEEYDIEVSNACCPPPKHHLSTTNNNNHHHQSNIAKLTSSSSKIEEMIRSRKDIANKLNTNNTNNSSQNITESAF